MLVQEFKFKCKTPECVRTNKVYNENEFRIHFNECTSQIRKCPLKECSEYFLTLDKYQSHIKNCGKRLIKICGHAFSFEQVRNSTELMSLVLQLKD